ncbi:hypothetical protein M1247_07065 [Mycobacterium sp. 21AC1]|uniref:hypothetical protein n=1 Tax=[Mycobacterium] appelbergii TaxID=2939269 RepID=UPI002938FD3F|nr:hypothetical protein [Mycobacterium sp. 21AC1]MDV3124668.1 hypothetical protein [Mycobacterium sp. 21AC1]
MGRSYIHVVAGTCVLALSVMIGAPGIAVADPAADGADSVGVDDSSGVTEPVTTASTGVPETAAAEPSAADSAADSAAAAERNAVEGVSSTVGSGRQPGDPAVTAGSTTEAPIVSTSSSAAVSGTVAPDPLATSSDSGSVRSDSDANTDSSTADSHTSTGATGTEVAPATTEDAAVTTDLAPVAATQVPYLALLGSSVMAAISDVVEAVTCLITDVVVGTLAQLQSGLAMLFEIAGVEPAVASLARIGIELPAPVRAALAVKYSASAPRALPSHKTLLPVNPTTTKTTALHALATVGATQFAAAAPSAPVGPAPTGPRSLLDGVGEKLLAIPSLMGLAVAALPGLSGLVLLTTAGVRLGYRQAKAGFAAQACGVARFARVEPSEVGRGAVLLFLRPRSRAQSLTATATLDEAA